MWMCREHMAKSPLCNVIAFVVFTNKTSFIRIYSIDKFLNIADGRNGLRSNKIHISRWKCMKKMKCHEKRVSQNCNRSPKQLWQMCSVLEMSLRAFVNELNMLLHAFVNLPFTWDKQQQCWINWKKNREKLI